MPELPLLCLKLSKHNVESPTSYSATTVDRSITRIFFYIDLSTLSESDKFVLQQRFQQLKPDNNGFIVKTVFETEEYSDPFCKQVKIIIW